MVSPESPNPKLKVGVYGSLRAGRHNHHYLRTASLIGRYKTQPEYTMIDLGPYPAIIGGGTTAIDIEVYAVDTATLAALDILEDHPNRFRRSLIRIENMEVYIYILTDQAANRIRNLKQRVIESGCW